jgi:hypothetical protein
MPVRLGASNLALPRRPAERVRTRAGAAGGRVGYDALLAFALRAEDLWSTFESVQVDEPLRAIPDELDYEAYEREWDAVVHAQAARLRTSWHDERLELLAGRLRAQLPLADYPRSSSALLTASETFERDEAVPRRIAELLLADSLSWRRVGLAAAA